MQIDWWPPDKLWQQERNPRRYNAREKKKAEAIIRRFGVRLPLVITSDGCVLSHFLVVIVARSLGLDALPVIYADDLSADERDQLSVALNQFYELGSFDRTLLGELFIDLEVKVPDLSFEAMGFEQAEADRVIMDCQLAPVDVERPLTLAATAVTKPGDIWLLDKHRIACSDAAEPDSYARLLRGEVSNFTFTDFPYGCEIDGFVSKRGRHREFLEGSRGKSLADMAGHFKRWCEQIRAVSKPGAVIELCIDWRSLLTLLNAATQVFGELLNLAVWVKDRAGMGSFLRSQHELILIFRMHGAPARNNVELGRHGRNRTNVWRYPSAVSFARTGAEGDLLDDHPTPKPKDMIADATLDCTARGDIVLDPFLGSGSTLIAAEKTGRLCRGMDLDPLYIDVAVRRWQAWTGKQAIHAVTGRLFDDVANELQAFDEGTNNA